MRVGLEVGPGFLSIKLFSPSPPFDALGPPAFVLATPSAGALDTVATLPGAALFDTSPFPPSCLAAALAGVLLVNLTDPAFDPGPTFEPAGSAPFALGLDAFDSLDLIGLFSTVLEGFLLPVAPGLLLTFPSSPSSAFFPSSHASSVFTSV